VKLRILLLTFEVEDQNLYAEIVRCVQIAEIQSTNPHPPRKIEKKTRRGVLAILFQRGPSPDQVAPSGLTSAPSAMSVEQTYVRLGAAGKLALRGRAIAFKNCMRNVSTGTIPMKKNV
jgi:hypothetical protein